MMHKWARIGLRWTDKRILAEEEISDVSLATFYVFDKENAHRRAACGPWLWAWVWLRRLWLLLFMGTLPHLLKGYVQIPSTIKAPAGGRGLTVLAVPTERGQLVFVPLLSASQYLSIVRLNSWLTHRYGLCDRTDVIVANDGLTIDDAGSNRQRFNRLGSL
jgi:hypothetical protein